MIEWSPPIETGRAFFPDFRIKFSYLLNTIFIIIGAWQWHIADISDPCRPGINLKLPMYAPLQCGDVTHRAWAQMLIPLSGAIARCMRNTGQYNVLIAQRLIRRSKERRDPPPIEVLRMR